MLATRYLVILARGYEDRITTSSRITKHPVALKVDWNNKIACRERSLTNALTRTSLFPFARLFDFCTVVFFIAVTR